MSGSAIQRVIKQPNPFARLLDSIVHIGRGMLDRRRGSGKRHNGNPEQLGEQCRELLNHRGEPSSLALASEILAAYDALSQTDRTHFFNILNRDFGTDPEKVIQAAESYRHELTFEKLSDLTKAVEPPCQKLFRRLNMVPGGTSALVKMRGQLLSVLKERPELRPVDAALRHLLIAWFNRGFLVIDQINWNSSARVLEKIIQYEAVHEINGWDDLRARLESDRRCFAFFHPAMPDDPIIFIEIALTNRSATAIQPLIESNRHITNPRDANTATFYSISNCHPGLQGISFGNFLIKQVTQELRHDLDGIKHFETLSPLPGFRKWVSAMVKTTERSKNIAEDLALVEPLLTDDGNNIPPGNDRARDACLRLCSHYLLNEKRDGEPLDPVARFHLSNGASLDRINWAADTSENGARRSLGMMVNYVYKLDEIEKNHEAYFRDEQIAASATVRKLAKR